MGQFNFELNIHGSTALSRALAAFSVFLSFTQPVGILGRYLQTEQHEHSINAYRHPRLESDSNPRPSVRAGEDGSCLRPRSHCDRLTFELVLPNI
jgi:hypothetical protein